MVAIGEIIHRLMLLVNYTDACFVCPTGYVFDIFSRLASLFELGVYMFGGLNGGL